MGVPDGRRRATSAMAIPFLHSRLGMVSRRPLAPLLRGPRACSFSFPGPSYGFLSIPMGAGIGNGTPSTLARPFPNWMGLRAGMVAGQPAGGPCRLDPGAWMLEQAGSLSSGSSMPMARGRNRGKIYRVADNAIDPAWSPDGRWLVYSGLDELDEREQVDLWQVRADGTSRQRLTNTSDREHAPIWIPES